MERRRTQPTLMDDYVSELGDTKIRAKPARLNAAVPRERLAAPISATYDNDTARGGRPNVGRSGPCSLSRIVPQRAGLRPGRGGVQL
ncbi:MAG: hypothetical protein ACYC26_08915 [Phycisphaerales bacterium]